jgi:hypothetical protein
MSEFKDWVWTDELVKEFVQRKVLIYTGNWPHDNVDRFINDFKASKQPKPEWEIVAFKHRGMIATIMDSEGYSQPHFQCPGQQFGLDWGLEGHDCSIHAVKRLSDGEVFTVGDVAHFKYYGNTLNSSDFKITRLVVDNSDIFVFGIFGHEKEEKLMTNLNLIFKKDAGIIPVLLTIAQIEKLKQILNTHD